MLVVGLTGGIGAGKSLVAEGFARRGIPIVDADQIARTLVQPGQSALQSIVARFGPEMLTPAGDLDRPRLRAHIFQHPEARRALEAILHPLIRAQMLANRAQLRADYAIFVVPLLIESNQCALVDRILVVNAPQELRLQRVLARDGIDRTQAEQILAAQYGAEIRLRLADDVIENAGDIPALDARITQLHQRYLALAACLGGATEDAASPPALS